MIPILIEIKASRPPGMLAKEFRQIMTAGYFEIAKYWHEVMLPLHFSAGAASRYGYEKRSKGYIRRKLRRKMHQRSLVWSGTLKRSTARDVRISATSKGAKVSFKAGSQSLNFSGPQDNISKTVIHKNKRGYPNIRRELTVTNETEKRHLARMLEDFVADELNETRHLRTFKPPGKRARTTSAA